MTIVPSISRLSAAFATSSGVAVPVVPSGRVYPRVRIGYLRPSGRGVFGRPRISGHAGKAAAPTPPPTGRPAGGLTAIVRHTGRPTPRRVVRSGPAPELGFGLAVAHPIVRFVQDLAGLLDHSLGP